MTDTATSRFAARQQSQGSNTNTWGDDKLNEAMRLYDRGGKGVQSLAMTGSTALTWTNFLATNDGQVSVLVLTGSLSSAANLVVPSREWQWDCIKNSTGQTITVKTSAGVGVAIPNGRQLAVFCDASDCYFGAPNYLGANITETNDCDLMDKLAVETAISTASLPATAGTVLVSATDTTANYLNNKISVSGALVKTLTNPSAAESITLSVGDGGLAAGGLQLASFVAVVGTAYVCPVGGTITLPAATGSRRKIELAVFGAGITTLSGTINGTSTFLMDGDQTLTLTDADVTRGFV